jgi:small basic protein
MTRQLRSLEIAYFLLIVGLHVAIALGSRSGVAWWYRSDDAFYYLRTARNIAMGLGSTFDGISLTNGYHPLWMAVCVAVFSVVRGDLWLPLRVLIVVSGALTAAGGVGLLRMFGQIAAPAVGAVLALVWALWPPIHAATTQLGLENALNGFLFILVLFLVWRLAAVGDPSPARLTGIGVSLALLLLARLDNIFVVGLLGLWVVLLGNPLRTRIVLYGSILSFSAIAGLLWRMGPGVFPAFKLSATAMVAAAWLVQVPILIFGIRYRSTRFALRAASVVVAGLVAAAAAEAITIVFRLTGLGSYPLLVPAYSGIVSIGLLLILEAYLVWLDPKAPARSARQVFLEAPRPWLRRALIVFGVVGVTLVAYMGWSQRTFGTPIPVSGQIKEWWGTIYSAYGRPPETVEAFLGLDPTRAGSPTAPIASVLTLYATPLPVTTFRLVAIAVIALILWMLRGRWLRARVLEIGLLPLGCGIAVLAWFYAVRGSVSIREWYWIGVYVFVMGWLGLVLSLAWRWLGRRVSKTILLAGVAVVGLAIVLNFAVYMSRRFLRSDPSQTARLEDSLDFLSAHTDPGSSIGVTGGGTIGYFLQDRTIVNLDGLANSVEYFRRSQDHDGTRALKAIGLDYVFAPGGMLPATEPYLDTFDRSLVPVARESGMQLFRFDPPE